MQFNAVITNIEAEHEGHILNGMLTLLGAPHHVTFIRVKEGDNIEPCDEAHPDVKSRFDDMQQFFEGAYETVELPGMSGRYVMFAFPYAV